MTMTMSNMVRIVQLPIRMTMLARPPSSSSSSSSKAILPRNTTIRRGFSSCPFQILGLSKNTRIPSKSNNNNNNNNNNPVNRFVEHSHSTSSSNNITYAQVNVAFRELAMKHHPDTNIHNKANASGSNGSKSNSSSTREFTRIREAFEAIVEGPHGMAILRKDHTNSTTEQQQQQYESSSSVNEMNVPNDQYYDLRNNESNGYLHPSVNPSILRELADVAEQMDPGGLDKGGMWQYANMIRTMADKDDGEGLPPLRVGGGDDDDDDDDENGENKNDAGKRVRRRRRRRR